jgi:hypothetical protein
MRMTGKRSVLRIEGFRNLNLKTGDPNEREAHQPVTLVGRLALEVADILRDHGAAWREANRGHVSLAQLKELENSIGQARPPRADSKNPSARQMNAQNPDAVASTAPMITV